jgi:hypothetical protein
MAIAAISWTASPLISFLFAPSSLTVILVSAIPTAIAICVWLVCKNLEKKFIYGQETPLRNV